MRGQLGDFERVQQVLGVVGDGEFDTCMREHVLRLAFI
jgi:hypothetical protein